MSDSLPDIDVGLFVGYAFNATDAFADPIVTVSDNDGVGFGTTWRFGGHAAESNMPASAP